MPTLHKPMAPWFLRRTWAAFRTNWYRRKPVFEGVYSSFDGIPYDGWFSSPEWAGKAAQQVRDAEVDSTRLIPSKLSLSKAMLACVVGPLLAKGETVRVVDFGGACGGDFAGLLNGVGQDAKISYLVVDDESLLYWGRGLFTRDPRISFAPTLPDEYACDVVYSCSALQYVKDYRATFATFASYNPKAMLFVRHCIGRETFARKQVNRGAMPEWVYGLDELTAIMAGHGYRLAMKVYSEDDFNSDNYDGDHRIEHSANVLFVKEE
jgi:putative methyltransferase (TIGR04325 family)